MKGTRYVDGVLVSQEHLNNTDNKKGAAIKERFGAALDYGIVEDGSNPFTVANNGNTSITLSSGEAFCDFDRNNTSPEHGNAGERIYVAQTLTELEIKNGPIASPDQRHILLVYLEIHKDRELDEFNVAHYTTKEDGYIVAQLTDSDLSALEANQTVYVVSNPIHSSQTDIYDLTSAEMDDTFGSGKWSEADEARYGGVTITPYNSIYLATVQEDDVAVETGVRSRPSFIINSNVLQLPDIEQLSQEIHRKIQHTNGIVGDINALKCVVDGTTVPDELKISNLGTGEYGYVNGQRFTTGELLSAYTSIDADNSTYFPFGDTEYFIYAMYDITDGNFKTEAVRISDVDGIIGIENYLLLCKVYINAAQDSIYAYENDNRYNAASSTNPVTDLRNFGTLHTNRISNEAITELTGDNLIHSSNFEQGENEQAPIGWNGSNISLDYLNSLSGKFSLTVLSSGIAISDPIPYNKLSAYSLEATLKSASTSTVSIGLRGYPGKDYLDVDTNDDPTNPINTSYYYPISSASLTTSWGVESGRFNRVRLSDEWTGTSGSLGTYSYPTDIDIIKYVRVVIKHVSGGTFYVDNAKLFETKEYHHDDLTIDGVLDISVPPKINSSTTTDITSEELEILSDGSDADALHNHATGGGVIESGTKMIFFQAAAPTGWTQDATQNDKALRIVSGTGGGVGGSHSISSPPTHVHSGGAHTHVMPIGHLAAGALRWTVQTSGSKTAVHQIGFSGIGSSSYSPLYTDSAGGSTGAATGFTPKYINVIVATKD